METVIKIKVTKRTFQYREILWYLKTRRKEVTSLMSGQNENVELLFESEQMSLGKYFKGINITFCQSGRRVVFVATCYYLER